MNGPRRSGQVDAGPEPNRGRQGEEIVQSPSVTVITPVYNGGKFIEETVDSVLAQGYARLEYLVLDDGSTDDTLARLRRFSKHLTVVSHANVGETQTVNKGLEMAKGDLLCVVNADDPLLPGAIESAATAYRHNPDAVAVYPDWLEIDSSSRAVREVRLPDYDILRMLTEFNVALGPGVYFPRRVLSMVGMRDAGLCFTGDLDFWLRLALHGRLVHVPELLATHRVHAAAASSAQRGAQMASELVRLVEKCYEHPQLPENLRAQQKVILSRAHFIASYYCGSDLAARAGHITYCVALAPGPGSLMLLKHFRYGLWTALPEGMRKSIKKLLTVALPDDQHHSVRRH